MKLVVFSLSMLVAFQVNAKCVFSVYSAGKLIESIPFELLKVDNVSVLKAQTASGIKVSAIHVSPDKYQPGFSATSITLPTGGSSNSSGAGAPQTVEETFKDAKLDIGSESYRFECQ